MKKIVVTFFSLITFVVIFSSKVQCQKHMPGFNHIAIYVNDLKKSTAFYHDIILLDTIPNPFNDGKHIFFKIGNHSQLHIIEGAPKNTSHNKNDHFAFSVNSIDIFINHLHKHHYIFEDWKGSKNTTGTRADGVKQIYFQDPDGYWIEINNDKY